MDISLLTILEWTSVLLNLLYVILLTREIVWAWPAGILGSAIGLFVLFDAKLYNDVWLFVLYVILGIYGWYAWVYGGKNNKQPPIIHTKLREGLVFLTLGALGTAVLGSTFAQLTDADIPYWDAFTSSFSVVGTYMQARKHLQNWLLWIIVDGVYIGVYWYKGLTAFAILSIIYLVLAAYGYWEWRKHFRAAKGMGA